MSKKIVTALASFGMSGQVFHGPLLKVTPGFQVSYVFERSSEHSRQMFPEATIVRSYEKLLAVDAIELVVINTPDHLHYSMVKHALEAGKHVVVEKPFVQRVEQADELLSLARRKKRMIAVFQNRRWDGDFRTVQAVIEGGKLGELVSYEAHFDRFKPEIVPSWKEQGDNGADILYNLGSHLIDQALQLFGLPIGVFLDLRTLRPGSKIADSFDLLLNYPKVKCMLRGSYLVMDPGPRYALHGTTGSFNKWGIDPQEEQLKAGKLPEGEQWGAEKPEFFGRLSVLGSEESSGDGQLGVVKVHTIPGDYRIFYQNVFAHLREGAELLVKPEQARDVIAVIQKAMDSAYTSMK